MKNNDHIIFIDSKGVEHNALVKSHRQHRDDKNDLVHGEPLVTLTYNLPTGEPKELIDVHHMGHPAKQETNENLPTYALHVWKYEHEDHLALPADHPIFDSFNEPVKHDGAGNVIPKRRPIYEKHLQWHKESKRAQQVVNGSDLPANQVEPQWKKCAIDGAFLMKDEGGGEPYCPTCKQKSNLNAAPEGHPAHPDTIHFEQQCVSCGENVQRVASHQGGTLWNDLKDVADAAVRYVAHVCDPEKVKSFAESLKPKKEPEMTELQRAALEPAGDPPKPQVVEELDVVKELEKAPPAPDEPKKAEPEGDNA